MHETGTVWRWGSWALLAVVALAVAGCRTVSPPDWEAWKARRLESIGGASGWTTLVARHWLTEGLTTLGSAPTNDVVLAAGSAPSWLGTVRRLGTNVMFEPAPGVEARWNGALVGSVLLRSDAGGDPTVVRVGELSITLIERGDRLGLRIRDPESQARREFQGLRYFPYLDEWRVEARFEAFAEPRVVRVADVTGGTQEMRGVGRVVFERGGGEYRLLAVQESGSEELFLMFRDRTTARSTYAGGRFLYARIPDAAGRLVLDFNRAYTPPCGFTPFATCPIPPEENALPFAVRAGERKPNGGH